MRVLVCGGRNYSNKDRLHEVLDELHLTNDDTIISGMAKGADDLAAKYSVQKQIMLDAFPAQWNKYGKSAGFKRNTQMLLEGKPDLVIAFPGGKGTDMMCKIAADSGVEVRRIT